MELLPLEDGVQVKFSFVCSGQFRSLSLYSLADKSGISSHSKSTGLLQRIILLSLFKFEIAMLLHPPICMELETDRYSIFKQVCGQINASRMAARDQNI